MPNFEGPPKQEQVYSPEELEALRKELEPIFNERFITLGHGTRMEAAEAILKEGLHAKYPEIESTAIGLENSDEGLKHILNWKHLNSRAIIVVMFPREKRVHQSQILEENKNADEQYGEKYTLPPKFLRGYIDVNSRKLILNDKFEENPEFRPRLDEDSSPRVGKHKGSVEVPIPSDTSEKADVW